MRVLVTGGAGYIGSHTSQQLIDHGHDVFVYDNLSTGFRAAVPTEARFIEGDILDAQKLSECMAHFKIEAVVHFAAKLSVLESVSKPLEYYENNTNGMIQLLKCCRANNIYKVIFSSTASVYGNSDSQSQTINEECAIAPLNPYGMSKRMCELILQDALAAHGIHSICLRYFNVAGASLKYQNGQRTQNAYHLIHVASQVAAGLRPHIQIFGNDYPTADGTCMRDYIHVEDLADIHVLALQHLEHNPHNLILNCGYGEGYSVQQVVRTMQKVSGVNFKVLESPRRPGDAASLVADSSKLKKILSWKPQRNNLEVICKSALEWEKHMILSQ